MTELERLRQVALAYAASGLRVFPVLAGRKEPATPHGVKDATTDPATIEAYWAAIPYLIGVACGLIAYSVVKAIANAVMPPRIR